MINKNELLAFLDGLELSSQVVPNNRGIDFNNGVYHALRQVKQWSKRQESEAGHLYQIELHDFEHGITTYHGKYDTEFEAVNAIDDRLKLSDIAVRDSESYYKDDCLVIHFGDVDCLYKIRKTSSNKHNYSK